MRNIIISESTISFSLKEVIDEAYKSVSNSDCIAVKVKAHEVHIVGTTLVF